MSKLGNIFIENWQKSLKRWGSWFFGIRTLEPIATKFQNDKLDKEQSKKFTVKTTPIPTY